MSTQHAEVRVWYGMATRPHRMPVEHLEAWGDRLETARTSARLSQRDLARAAGCTQQSLSRVGLGKVEVSDALKIAIAGAIGLPPDFLFPLEPPHRWPPLPAGKWSWTNT